MYKNILAGDDQNKAADFEDLLFAKILSNLYK